MPDIEHLSLEEDAGAIIQDKLVHESQRGSKVGNLPADSPDTHHRKPRHSLVQY